MVEEEFVRLRMDSWTRLRNLSLSFESDASKFSAEDFEELMDLYQSAVSDLARARAESTNEDMIESLNAIVAAAYGAIYRRPPAEKRVTFRSIAERGAQAFRNQFRFVVASALTVLTFYLIAYNTLTYRPDLRSKLISPAEEELFEHWKKGEHSYTEMDQAGTMLVFYATNNPLVSVIWAARGAGTFGIGSGVGLAQLGLQIGALSHETSQTGAQYFMFSSIAPHGATELSGAVVSGAAGYYLGWSLIAPGKRRRLDSLRHAAKDGMALFIMAVIMMFIAAPFEAFFSFRPEVPQASKVAVAVVVFMGWCWYWALVGRAKPNVTAASGANLSAVSKPGSSSSF